ncbi:tape measure protein, partial [Klebsiella pneumoniae]|nr:tape measure protein [Klebsiella pneumoniae]
EEFNSVLEQMPELARQIADGMGIPFNELRQLMLAGKLDIGEVLAAIEKRSDEINQQFEKMPRTVTQATNALVTQFGVAVSKIDDAIGASRYLAKLLDGAALSISVATGSAPDAVMLTQKLEQNTEQLAVAESDLAKARKAGLGWGVKQTEQTVKRLKAERALILMAQQASKDSQSVYTPSKGEKPAYITNLEKKTAENNANSIIKSGQTVVDKLTQQREQLSKDKSKGLIDDKKYADAAAVLDKQIADARKKQDKTPKNAFARGDDSIDNLQRQIAVLTMRYDENTREAAQFNAVAALGAKATDAQKERVRELAGQLFDAQQRQKDLNDAISNDPLRKENKAYSDGRDQLKRQLDGQMIDQKTYNQQSELMEQQHQVNLAKIRAQQVVTPQQQAAGEVDPVQRLANQHAQELALIQQFEQQKTITEQEALALRNAANNTYEKQRIEAQWEIFRNQSTTNELMAAAVDGFASQAASSMTGLINGTQSATEAFKNLGNAILNSVIQALVEVGIQYLKNAAMAMIADKMTSNSSQQAGAQTAAAWAPAAAAASIATFGGAAIAGIAGMVAAFAIGAALAGKRKNGGTVGAGGAYQVGEGNMPELLQTKNGLIMIPGDKGRVFSNKDVTGSSPTIQKASTGKEYLPDSSASSSQSGDSSKRPIQVNIQLIDQTTGSQHNITGTDAFQQGDVVTVTGFLNDVDTGGPMSTAIADAHGLRRQARGAF